MCECKCHCTFDILAMHQGRRWNGRPASFAPFISNTNVLKDGKLDVAEAQAIARCGYYSYTVVKETRKRHMRHDYP